MTDATNPAIDKARRLDNAARAALLKASKAFANEHRAAIARCEARKIRKKTAAMRPIF
jgi:hypothetical protein